MKLFSLFSCLGSLGMISATMAADLGSMSTYLLDQSQSSVSFLTETVDLEISFNKVEDEELAKIIKADDVEQLKKKTISPTFNVDHVMVPVSSNLGLFNGAYSLASIPIIHYAAMTKATRCLKFLLLSGADPVYRVRFNLYPRILHPMMVDFDCAAFAGFGGNIEILKILEEENGMDYSHNPGFWFFAGLGHQNELLEQVYSDQDYQYLNMMLFGMIMGNYVEEFNPQKPGFAWWGGGVNTRIWTE